MQVSWYSKVPVYCGTELGILYIHDLYPRKVQTTILFRPEFKTFSIKMSVPSSTRLPVGNKDFTNATLVIIGAGISGMLVLHD